MRETLMTWAFAHEADRASDADRVPAEQVPGEAARAAWPGWVLGLKRVLGLDRAIAFTILARGVQILGSTGTVLLILRFLSPVEQGYYYTLLSAVSLQVVFELGFSFVVLQMAAHECAHLTLHADGRIEGDATAHARLASILQKTLRWYLVAAVILCASLPPVGAYFFSRHAHATSPVAMGPVATPVAWQGPLVVAVSATAVLFLLNPFFSFLEGCGLVWQVGRMRFGQALLGVAMSWGAFLGHHGLYSPGMVNLGYSAVAVMFLAGRRRLWLGLLRHTVGEHAVSWRREIWPFQWKIAVTWLSVYLGMSIFTPVLFAYRGPADAGRLGMSLSIATYMWTLVLAWMSTKATPFGQMIARGEFDRLDQLFFRTLWQSLAVLTIITGSCEAGLIGLGRLYPNVAARIVSPGVFALILATTLAVYVIQSLAVYLRAHKSEPFLWQSLVVAGLTCGALFLLVPRWGISGVAVTYLLCTGVVGLSSAIAIFRARRKARLVGNLV